MPAPPWALSHIKIKRRGVGGRGLKQAGVLVTQTFPQSTAALEAKIISLAAWNLSGLSEEPQRFSMTI